MTRSPRPSTLATPRGAGIFMAAALALLWVIEAIDQVLQGQLDAFGIRSWNLDGLSGILVAPLLHAGWPHLLNNSVPFAVLGFLALLGGVVRWVVATVSSITVSGLFAWLLSPPNTLTVGASGLIFGWLTYLLTRGLFSRDLRQIGTAVVVFVVYGGVLWGVLPGDAGISWQGHLGGAVGGVLAAWWAHSRKSRLAST